MTVAPSKKTAPPSEDDLVYRRNEKRHSFSESQEPEVMKCLRKHLSGDEEINFKFSRTGGSYAVMSTTGRRELFCKRSDKGWHYLYDADSLIEDWESNNSKEFKKSNNKNPHIYLHLAIAYVSEKDDWRKSGEVLSEFIKNSPDANGEKVSETIEDYAWLFPVSLYGFSIFARCYLGMNMLQEAALTYTAFGNLHFAKGKAEDSLDGYSHLLLGQFSEARTSLAKYQKRMGHLPSDDFKKNMTFKYYWALAMEKWQERKTEEAYAAIRNAKKLTDRGSPEEKLMTYLEGLIHSGKGLEAMPQQISLLNRWRENADADAVPEKKEYDSDEINQLLLREIQRVQESISVLSGTAAGMQKPVQMAQVYARMWTNETDSEGEAIKTREEADALKNSPKYCLVIFKKKTCTELFVNKKEAVLPGGLMYKTLEYALKHQGSAGTAWNIAKHLWDLKEAEKLKDLKEMASALKMQPRIQEATMRLKVDETKKGIALISKRINRRIEDLNRIFLSKFRVRLKANELGEYEFSPNLEYCLMEEI